MGNVGCRTNYKHLVAFPLLATLIAIAQIANAAVSSAPSTSSANPQEMRPSVTSRRSVIAKLQTIQAKQAQLIGEIDEKVKSKLKETQGMKVTDDAINSELRMTRLQETMEGLDQKRKEAIERSQFVDRLIFAIDTKWTKDSIKVFLEQTLLDIASAEMNQTDSKTPSDLWKFATYLSVAIRELPEPREDLIAFIDNYMEYSSVRSPKSPAAFSQARSYTNGVSSESAKVTSQENLGDGVEKQLKRVGKDEPAIAQGTTSAPIDIVKPVPRISDQPVGSPLEPAKPKTLPPNAPNPEPTASQNSN